MEDDLSGLRRLSDTRQQIYSLHSEFQKGSPTHVN